MGADRVKMNKSHQNHRELCNHGNELAKQRALSGDLFRPAEESATRKVGKDACRLEAADIRLQCEVPGTSD